jgi:hypothetical protein
MRLVEVIREIMAHAMAGMGHSPHQGAAQMEGEVRNGGAEPLASHQAAKP